MLALAALLMVSAVAVESRAPLDVGVVERDLTGDGKPEILRVVRDAETDGEPSLTFTIESAGKLIYVDVLVGGRGFQARRRGAGTAARRRSARR